MLNGLSTGFRQRPPTPKVARSPVSSEGAPAYDLGKFLKGSAHMRSDVIDDLLVVAVVVFALGWGLVWAVDWLCSDWIGRIPLSYVERYEWLRQFLRAACT
jgi:hypothetical protein